MWITQLKAHHFDMFLKANKIYKSHIKLSFDCCILLGNTHQFSSTLFRITQFSPFFLVERAFAESYKSISLVIMTNHVSFNGLHITNFLNKNETMERKRERERQPTTTKRVHKVAWTDLSCIALGTWNLNEDWAIWLSNCRFVLMGRFFFLEKWADVDFISTFTFISLRMMSFQGKWH